MKILSIDAWKENGDWTWNQWYSVGNITKEDFEKLETNRKIIKYFRDGGYLSKESKGKVSVEDDQFNIMVCVRSDKRPLFAIEYGPEY